MKRYQKMYRPFLLLGLLAAIMLLMLTATETHSQGSQINDRASFRRPTAEVLQLPTQLRGDVETRMSLGLNADVAYVQNLRGSPEDVGSEKFNVPMTQAENDEMQERWDFASATRDTIMPYVRELPTFAGAYYDHSSNGDLIILLTDVDSQISDQISSLAPEGRDTRIEIVDYTQTQLREAVKTVWQVWPKIGAPEIYAIAVDVPANAIRIEVDAKNLTIAENLVSQVSTIVGVPMFATVGKQPVETACSSRHICHSPMKAGTVHRKGSLNSSYRCTMGFHVQSGSDVQFVTAGHCSHSGSNDWYHVTYGNDGYVGSKQATLYSSNGIDIMRVQMDDSQASKSVFGSAAAINAVDWPTTGMWVCASLGISGSWSCGNVSDNYTSWTGDECDCTIYGGDSTISSYYNDSGSPIVDGNLTYTAIGIQNTAEGGFAIFKDALLDWPGWWIH